MAEAMERWKDSGTDSTLAEKKATLMEVPWEICSAVQMENPVVGRMGIAMASNGVVWRDTRLELMMEPPTVAYSAELWAAQSAVYTVGTSVRKMVDLSAE